MCIFLLGAPARLRARILPSFCSQEGKYRHVHYTPQFCCWVSGVYTGGEREREVKVHLYLKEFHFLVSKVLFSNCQTTFPPGPWVTSKQRLYSLKEGLKNLDKGLRLLPPPLCPLKVSTIVYTLVKSSSECVCSANIGYAESLQRSHRALVEKASVSAKWLLATTDCQRTCSAGVYKSKFNMFWSVPCSHQLSLCVLLFLVPYFCRQAVPL